MKYNFSDLVRIMEILRSKKGCPWDRKQTCESLVQYLINEVYELVDAMNNKDYENMKEELGDVLFILVFISQVSREKGKFDIYDVIDGICRKMIFRHPHVFGNEEVRRVEDVEQIWERQKEKEGRSKKLLEGIPKSLPPIERAYELQRKASSVGFDWKDYKGPMGKVSEELNEVREAVKLNDKGKIKEEIGDLLFSVINLSRLLNVNPTLALSSANAKFTKRFKYMESKGINRENMENLWNEAKEEE